MKIENPFKLQNWKIKKFLIVVLSIQISLLGLFTLNNLGIDTPIIRPLIGFIYLSFVPGYLFLRILKLHNLDSIESFLYALGLSLFMDMLVGFLMNMLYPTLGVTNKPISEISVIFTMAVVIFLLCIFAYLRDKNYNNPDFIDLKDILNPQVLFLSLIPLMSIFGTYLVNYYHNNILLMIMIVVIALVALIIGFTNWIDKKYYPYAIWVMAIALILHITLISPYIVINDNIGEYYVAKTVLEHNYWLWNANVFSTNTYNSVLSVVILAPIISIFMKINLIWIYKLIFPYFYSMVPVGVYAISKYIFKDDKIAFISSLLFISPLVFIRVSLITKQVMAMLFGTLLVYTCAKGLRKNAIKSLIIFFSIGLIISHYGTAYLFCAMLSFIVVFIKLWHILLSHKKEVSFKEYSKITLFFLIFTISWYMYISNSVSFNAVVNILNFALHSIYSEFLNPYSSRGLYTLTKQLVSISSYLTKYLLILVVISTTVGYFSIIFSIIYDTIKSKIYKLKTLFILGCATFWFGILGASVIIPHLAAMDPQRLFLESLIILSGFSVIGWNKLIKYITNSIKYKKYSGNAYLKLSCIISILIMLLSGTKLVPEIINDCPTSIAISQEHMLNSNNPLSTITYFLMITPTQNIFSGGWIKKNGNLEYNIYRMDWVECYPSLIVYNNIEENKVKDIAKVNVIPSTGSFNITVTNIQKSYIQLTYPNVHYHLYWTYYNPLHKIVQYNATMNISYELVYNNGGSQILLS